MNEIQLLKRLDGNPNIIQLVEHDLRSQQSKEGTLLIVSCSQLYDITSDIRDIVRLQVMELGEIDFSRLLQERAGLPISPPWIVVHWKQVASHNPLSKSCLVQPSSQMLEAVGVIHDEKIVHSDLKPANFVLVKGRLKLIDFGIANAIANDTTNIQRDNQVQVIFLYHESC